MLLRDEQLFHADIKNLERLARFMKVTLPKEGPDYKGALVRSILREQKKLKKLPRNNC